jgi:very-short-patch-repair endonuclease
MEIGSKKIRQIFQYLEAFNQQRNPVIRQVDEQEWALWLKNLPVQPTITRNTESDDSFVLKVGRANLTFPPAPPQEIKDWLQPGWEDPSKAEKLVEYKTEKDGEGHEVKVRFEDSPERLKSYGQWKVKRDTWAGQERPAREAYKIFERIYTLYNRIEREAGRLELVLGDGILNWRLPLGGINHPILLQRLQLTFDPQKPEFTFQITNQPVELYTALMRTSQTVDPKLIAQIREQCEEANFDLIDGRSVSEFLKGVVTRLASGGQFIPEDGIRGESDYPRIALDPVIIARQRTLGYARAIEAILEEIPTLQLEEIPSSLLNITGVELQDGSPVESSGVSLDGGGNEDEEILFNKPANPEQLLIAKRLERYGSVLVQGPPGTGKTHTIANLIGHLLAKGQSVLVTSHTTKALRVLRDKVDPGVQSLCVSVLDNDTESQAQMSASINEIAERLNDDSANLERKAAELKKSREEIIEGLRRLRTRLYDARASEYRDLSVGGKLYTPAQAARLVQEGRSVNDWLPGPALSGHSLPLSEREVEELYQTNQIITAEDEHVLASGLPDPDLLMPASQFADLVRNLESLSQSTDVQNNGFWGAHASVLPDDLTALLANINRAVDPISQGLNDQFRLALINDSRRGAAYRAPWDELIERIEEVVKAAGECRSLSLTYGPKPADNIPLEQQLKVLEEIITHLGGGGGLGKLNLWFRTEWKTVIEQASVDGKRPSEIAHFKALHATTRLEILRMNLINRWDRHLAPLGVPPAKSFSPHPEEVCSQYIGLIRSLLCWQEAVWQPAETALRNAGFDWDAFLRFVPLNPQPNGELFRLADAVQNHLPAIFEARIVKLRREELECHLASYHSQLKAMLASGQSAELLVELLRAVELRDVNAYSKGEARIVELHGRHQTYLRRCGLLARLDQSAPGWARAIRLRSGVHAAHVPPGEAKKAWLWRQLNDRLDEIAEESIAEIQAEIERSVADLQRVTAELIEVSAWACQIRRTELKQKQTLTGWVQTMRRIGKGTGKRVPDLLAQARRLMDDCRSAVPVWIMPLARVVENYQPHRGLFDVVIIDEASQCDVMGLIALYLGKKVIVVGDHEQVSPDAVGDTVEAARNLINIYLRGIPNAELFDGKLSIYDLAMQSFSGTVCLREHFRCVPEIIGFSNKLSYEGKVKPLRDDSHNPLSPAVIAHYVHNGQSNAKVNEVEAETVASMIVAAIEQPEYEGQTIGVISLVGEDQAAMIERLLRSKLDPTEFTKRKITCGNAAQFQGDERHVMFLSVVDGPAQGPLRLRQDDLFKKRFNVAASRAQNQLWVIHSLQPAIDLQAADLRRQLIEYTQNPKAHIEALDKQLSRAESEFERQVLQRLISSGYQITPQWKVGVYRIDMVVCGGGRRIALECDGDRWHPTEKIPEDMERQAVLERLGWKFIRIRGSQFFRDQDRVMKDVLAQLERSGVVSETIADVPKQEESELSARVIRRAEQLRMEWKGPDIESLLTALDEQETITHSNPPWQISGSSLDPLPSIQNQE